MYCNQIFSLINDGEIKNIIVCDNYTSANQIAMDQYGVDAVAVDTTLYPVIIGDSFIDGVFMRGEEIIKQNPTEAEQIAVLTQENEFLKAQAQTLTECILEMSEIVYGG